MFSVRYNQTGALLLKHRDASKVDAAIQILVKAGAYTKSLRRQFQEGRYAAFSRIMVSYGWLSKLWSLFGSLL